MARKPSAQQRRFVQEWMVDMNGTRAAIRAGYSPRGAAQTASRLMKEPAIQAYRDELMKAEVQELGISRESMIREIWRIYQRCTEASPVMIWDSDARAYVESGEWKFDSKGALKAVGMLLGVLPGQSGGDTATPGTTLEELLTGEREF